MGNRSSQPQSPPALLSAAVIGDASKFQAEWGNEKTRLTADNQSNNVLHALFSCRANDKKNCKEILETIRKSLSELELNKLYDAQNMLGCTPLWILSAYGNVSLLQEVQGKMQQEEFSKRLLVPNHQGDTCLLATCSQGNLEMVKYLKETLETEQFAKLIQESNQKGTTPLQIVIANGHLSLLEYFLKDCQEFSTSQLFATNSTGLSLFHICSERNFNEGLKLLLSHVTKNGTDAYAVLERVVALKDKNKASALHVASFCGNTEAEEVWIEMLKPAPNAEDLLDAMDDHARTPYWLAMVQGHDKIGEMLAATGVVDTKHPKMIQEIQEAQQRREEMAEKRKNSNIPVDGNALLGGR
jgi:ankyrin repeat protein